MLDIVVADQLRTGLRPPIPESEEDWVARAGVWRDPRAVVGGSDAGAHLDVMCGAIYSTSLLGDGVRKRGLLDVGGGGPPACVGAGLALRTPGPWPDRGGLVGRHGHDRPGDASVTVPNAPRPTCRAGRAGSTPAPTGSSTCS